MDKSEIAKLLITILPVVVLAAVVIAVGICEIRFKRYTLGPDKGRGCSRSGEGRYRKYVDQGRPARSASRNKAE